MKTIKTIALAAFAALALGNAALAMTEEERAAIRERFNEKRCIARDVKTKKGYAIETWIQRGVITVVTNKLYDFKGSVPTNPYNKKIVEITTVYTNLQAQFNILQGLYNAQSVLLSSELQKLYEDRQECEANIVEFQEKYDAWKSIPVFGTGIALYFKTKLDREKVKLDIIIERIAKIEERLNDIKAKQETNAKK